MSHRGEEVTTRSVNCCKVGSLTPMDDLKLRTFKGLSWSALGVMARQPVSFVTRLVMARLLSAGEFGQFAMIWVLLELGKIVTELGLGPALVQKEELEERHCSTAFWLVGAVSTLLFVVGNLLAPVVSSFYGQPELERVFQISCVVFPLGGLSVVHQAVLTRSLNFRRLAFVEVTSTVVASACGVTCALFGYGVWSLVYQALVLSGLSTLLTWLVSGWRPHWVFSMTAFRELRGFGSNLVAFRALNFLVMSVDDILIGRLLGPMTLGFYSKAYWIMLFPVRQVSEVVTRVMFPALSGIKDERERFKRTYLAALSSIGLVTFPAMLGLMVCADTFVPVVFGPQWGPVTPILRVFCIVGLLHSIGTTVGWIYTSQGRTDRMFKWAIFAGLVKCMGIVVGLQWGVLGVAWGCAVTAVLLDYPSYTYAGKLVGIRYVDVLRAVGPTFGCALTMAIGLVAFRIALPELPPAVQLGLQVIIGAVSYAILVRCSGIEAYRRLKGVVADYREHRTREREPPTRVEA